MRRARRDRVRALVASIAIGHAALVACSPVGRACESSSECGDGHVCRGEMDPSCVDTAGACRPAPDPRTDPEAAAACYDVFVRDDYCGCDGTTVSLVVGCEGAPFRFRGSCEAPCMDATILCALRGSTMLDRCCSDCLEATLEPDGRCVAPGGEERGRACCE